MADPLVREAAKLYGLPRERFTAARNDRARVLRGKDADLAAAVAALPKPTLSAAALNAVARDDPSEIRAVIQCGKRLHKAQEAAVKGRKADLTGAIAEHRAALERVQKELSKRALSAQALERAVATLRVASVDPALQPRLERGILHEDVSASGFDLLL